MRQWIVTGMLGVATAAQLDHVYKLRSAQTLLDKRSVELAEIGLLLWRQVFRPAVELTYVLAALDKAGAVEDVICRHVLTKRKSLDDGRAGLIGGEAPRQVFELLLLLRGLLPLVESVRQAPYAVALFGRTLGVLIGLGGLPKDTQGGREEGVLFGAVGFSTRGLVGFPTAAAHNPAQR